MLYVVSLCATELQENPEKQPISLRDHKITAHLFVDELPQQRFRFFLDCVVAGLLLVVGCHVASHTWPNTDAV
jgi:S-adenosylmethionine/arginine decarboxylase-like enzyme